MDFRRAAPTAVTSVVAVAAFATAGPVVAVPAAAAVAAALLPRMPVTLFWAALAAVAASALGTWLYGGGDDNRAGPWWIAESLALAVLLSRTVARLPRSRALIAGAALLAVLAVSPLRLWLRLEPPSPPGDLILLSALWTAAGLVAIGVGAYPRRQALRHARAVVAERRAQRTALARDLHDFVAHDVSGIVVVAQAALVVGENDPAQAMSALRLIEKAGLSALSTLDRTVHALHSDVPAPEPGGVEAVTALIERFRETTAVTTAIDPGLTGLPPVPAAAVHRLVAEALTNVRAHAPGATGVHIGLTLPGRELRVEVANDLPGRSSGRLGLRARERRGLGLAGLDELVTALGGRFHAGPGDHGWRLSATIPLEERA